VKRFVPDELIIQEISKNTIPKWAE